MHVKLQIYFYFLLLFLFFSTEVNSAVFISAQSGNWGDASTWTANQVPAATDDVIIDTTHTVSLNTNVTVNHLTIRYNATLENGNRTLTVNGNYTINGTHDVGSPIAQERLRLEGNNAVIDGTGTITNASSIRIHNNKSIASTANITVNAGHINFNNILTLTNYGIINLKNNIASSQATAQWVNAEGSTLNIEGELLSTGVLVASATANTVNYNGPANQTVKLPQNDTYYNLKISGGGTKTLPASFNISGDLIVSATLGFSTNYTINIAGKFDNSISANFIQQGTVRFNGNSAQSLKSVSSQTFYNLAVGKGSGVLNLENSVIVTNTISLDSGIINTQTAKLILGTSATSTGTLNYTSGQIIGKFERWIGSTGIQYLFPVGTAEFSRPAGISFNHLNTGTVIFEFTELAPGSAGFPLNDNGISLYNTFSEGYWILAAANSLTTNNYDLELNANGFNSFTINSLTRIVARNNATSNWEVRGTHVNASGDTTYREGLNVTQNQQSAQFAIADTTPCSSPVTSSISGSTSICKSTSNQTYSVTNTPGSGYTWTVTGGSITSGQGGNSITVDWDTVGMQAEVKVVETNSCSPGAPVTLTVNLHPLPASTITGSSSVAEFSTNVSYSVINLINYSYTWTVTNGSITSGQGTNSITVSWNANGTGKVSVLPSHISCGNSATLSLNVSIFPVINSIASGSWDNTNTWDCNCVPQPGNSVRIRNTHTVNVASQSTNINNLTIDNGGVLDNTNRRLLVNGNYTNNGTHAGSQRIEINGENVSGTGTITNSDEVRFNTVNKHISSGTNLTISICNIRIDNGLTITNNGLININGSIIGGNASSAWQNAANSTLEIGGELLATGTLLVNSLNNNVIYKGTANQSIKTPSAGEYFNLNIYGSGDKSLGASIVVLGDIEISSTLVSNNHNITLKGDWINTGTFTQGTGTLVFNSSTDQYITQPSAQNFYNLSVTKSAQNLILNSKLTVSNELTLSGGIINTQNDTLTLGTSTTNQGTLSHSSGFILGTFQRWVNNTGIEYLFPIGYDVHYRAIIPVFAALTGGSVIARFIPVKPENSGLPATENGLTVFNPFTEGYWKLSSPNGFSSNNYDLKLVADGFTSYTLEEVSRLLTRENINSDWTLNGTHLNAANDTIKRESLSIFPAEFAAGDTTGCDPPLTSDITGPVSVCGNVTNVQYSVVNNTGNTYTWTVSGGSINTGQGNNVITVNWGSSGSIGTIKVVESDGCISGTPIIIEVTKHPMPASAISGSDIVGAFTSGHTYSVEARSGYTYNWNISGGTINSGQGTNVITVSWDSTGQGLLEVFAQHSCGTANLVVLNVYIFATIHSVTNGDWDQSTTWDCSCVPSSTNNVVIDSGHTVNLVDNTIINNITIKGTLDNSSNTFEVNGNYIVDGIHTGSGEIKLQGNNSFIGGTGVVTNSEGLHIINYNKTITSGSDLTISSADLDINGTLTINNLGSVTINGDLIGHSSSSTWINANNSNLTISGVLLSTGSLNASGTANTVVYSGTSAQNIKNPVNNTYFHLILSDSNSKTLQANTTINGNLTINSSLNTNSFNINILGNWINQGDFNAGTGTVTFTGTANQEITQAQNQEFYNLTINKSGGQLIANSDFIVSNNLNMTQGIINVSSYTLTLGTSALNTGSLSYNSGRIIGKFERWISNTSSDIYFPIGNTNNLLDATINFYNLNAGSLIIDFISNNPGNNGLPLNDGLNLVVHNTFTEGYWTFDTANSLSSTNYFVKLSGNGFISFDTDTATRVLSRAGVNDDWTVDGAHVNASGNTAIRDSLNSVNRQFALATVSDCLEPETSNISGDTSVCKNQTNVTYSVSNTTGSTYLWSVNGGTQSGGGNSNSITVSWGSSGMTGKVSVIETNDCDREGSAVELDVIIHPLPVSSVSGRVNVAENTLSEPYSVTTQINYSYNWIVTGGTVESGQGTNAVNINWGSAGTGSIKVAGSHSTCGNADTVSLSVNIYPDIKSITSGNWSSSSTWDCNCVPFSSDNVIIDSLHTVTLTFNTSVNNLTVNNAGILDNDAYIISVNGNYTINGTHTGNNRIDLWGNNTGIYGKGTISTTAETRIVNYSKYIDSTADITHTDGNLKIENFIELTNNGTYNLNTDIIGGNTSSKWTNAQNSKLIISGNLLNTGILDAQGENNLVHYNSNGNQSVKSTLNNIYHNIEISGSGVKSLTSVVKINGDLKINNTASLDVSTSDFDLQLKGMFINSGDFNAGTGTVFFTGNSTLGGLATTTFYHIEIIDSASFTAFPSANFNIKGNWNNKGVFNHNEGTVTFSGSTQSINGKNTFNNLIINNGSEVTMSDTGQEIISILLSNGTLNADGNLTLISTADRTALIDGNGSGDVLGNVKIQRYLPSAFGYIYLSSPFTSAKADIFNDVVDFNSVFPHFYRYDESSTITGWKPYADTSDLEPMHAYSANLGNTALPVTIEIEGVVNNGNLSHTGLTNSNETFTQGFNLVGNPYPSPINWSSSSGWTKTNIDDAIYFFNAGTTNQYTGSYSSMVNGVKTANASDTIAALQGFFVHVTDSQSTASLGFSNAVRVNDLNAVFHKDDHEHEFRPLLRLAACESDANVQKDETVIYFQDKATKNFNPVFDARKKMNTDEKAPNIYTFSSTHTYSIKALPLKFDATIIIPLKVDVENKGVYSIKATEILNLPQNTVVFIEDLKLGITHNITLNPEYRTFIDENESKDRFRIVFAPDGNIDYFNTETDKIFDAYSYGKNIYVLYNPVDVNLYASVSIYDIMGKEILKKTDIKKGSFSIWLEANPGIYILRLYNENYEFTEKLFIRN